MAKALPAQPNLDWLRKTAKAQLAELRRRDTAAKLHQAQLAVARDYGFASWRALKAHVDTVGLDGQIIAAAANGRARELDRLLSQHPRKIAVTGSEWNRPLLHIAAGEGHLDCVNVLLRRGFDVKKRDKFDNATAMHWAAQSGVLPIVKRLADAGSNVEDRRDLHELGVLGWATCFRRVHKDVADYLLSLGAKPTIFSAVALNRADLVRELVGRDSMQLRNAKMSRFEHHRSPLHLAVLKNRPQMVKLLLELGADPSGRDGRGYTPLGLATARTNNAIAAMLIAAGADPKEQHRNRFEHIVPILNVRNIVASFDYYVGKLGFEKKWEWGEPPTFGCVARDEVSIFLSQGAQGSPGTWISIFVQDIDALHEAYKRSGAIVREPPRNYPWGLREMTVEDLDGHRLRMGGDGGGEYRSDEGIPADQAS